MGVNSKYFKINSHTGKFKSNISITGKDSKEMWDKINEDLENIRERVCCNKLYSNVLKTHYMVSTPRNIIVNDIDICINGACIERVYATKFLGMQIDSQLNWKKHIHYICKKLSKCVGILAKSRKKLYKSCFITLYYSFAYPYVIYCNHVWGNALQTALEKMVLVQKKLIRIITCPNVYIKHSQYISKHFHTNRACHSHDTRHANDLCVFNNKIIIRECSVKEHDMQVWHDIPDDIKTSSSIDMFKRKFVYFLIDRRLTILVGILMDCTIYWCWYLMAIIIMMMYPMFLWDNYVSNHGGMLICIVRSFVIFY